MRRLAERSTARPQHVSIFTGAFGVGSVRFDGGLLRAYDNATPAQHSNIPFCMYGVWLGCRVAGFRFFGRGLGSEGLMCAMTAKLTQRVHVATCTIV